MVSGVVALGDTLQSTDDAPKTVSYRNVCPKCGKIECNTLAVPDWARNIMDDVNTCGYCEDCRRIIAHEESVVIREKYLEDQFAKSKIPGGFLAWDTEKGNNALARKIRNNRNKSLWICGANSSCKTRAAAYNLQLEIAKSHKRCRFYRFVDLAAEYAAICKKESEASHSFIESLLNENDVIMIDDIGKRRITENAGEMLYDLFDRLYSGMNDTLVWVTSNFTLSGLSAGFVNPDVSDGVISRIDRMIESGEMIVIEAI